MVYSNVFGVLKMKSLIFLIIYFCMSTWSLFFLYATDATSPSLSDVIYAYVYDVICVSICYYICQYIYVSDIYVAHTDAEILYVG